MIWPWNDSYLTDSNVFSYILTAFLTVFTVRPTKPPPPPRSLPPAAKLQQSPAKSAAVQLPENGDSLDGPKESNSSTSGDDNYEPVNFSAPECDHHGSPEMARLTSMQYCGSETESETYPTIRFGDDVSFIMRLLYFRLKKFNLFQWGDKNAVEF